MKHVGPALLCFSTLAVHLSAGCRHSVRGAGVEDGKAGMIDVVARGADPGGRRDATDVLTRLHRLGRPVYYRDGTYRFNGATLDFSGGVRFESAAGVVIRNDISPSPIVVFDDDGNLIGLQQNHLEQNEQDLGGPLPVRSGSLVPPPPAAPVAAPPVDILAHWYNDFGLECRRVNLGSGWIGWYYWSWNFHGASGDGYDPSRHPLLGFYRGDDPVVLDWQCRWLYEYGVTGVVLCWSSRESAAALTGWDRPASPVYWLHQLFNRTPHFKRLKYVMWAPTPWLPSTPENRAKVERGWLALIENIYLRYPNCYSYRVGGRRYPVLYLWEEGAIRGVFDNYRGAEKTHAFYARIARRFQEAGFDGVALFARHPHMPGAAERARLEQAGVRHFRAYYSDPLGRGPRTYRDLVDQFEPPSDPYTVVNVVTAHHSHTPHPSRWKCPGSTPALFRALLSKAVRHVRSRSALPQVITCYNVAEWAEGGPGLQPNMRDRFGYLEAVRSALSATLPSRKGHE